MIINNRKRVVHRAARFLIIENLMHRESLTYMR